MHTGFWWDNKKERHHYENVDMDAMIMLKWILEQMGRNVLDSSGPG
jgi:hypothetical protein